MRVYLLGTPALAIYNFGNGILSAAGDSKRPLYYLFAAGMVNIVLNLFFVVVCNLSVMGVALASAISQYLSAFLILRRLFTCSTEYALSMHEMRIDGVITKTVLMLGLPTALQNAIFAVANLFIQAAVNSFDTHDGGRQLGGGQRGLADLRHDERRSTLPAPPSWGRTYGAGNRRNA